MAMFTIEAKLYTSNLTVRHVPNSEVTCTWNGQPAEAVLNTGDSGMYIEEPKPRGNQEMKDVEVTVPHETVTYKVSLAAGNINIDTTALNSKIKTAAGNIEIARLVDSEAKTGAGNITVADLEASEVKAGAGGVNLGHVQGKSEIKTGTGNITVDSIDGHADPRKIEVKSGTGDIRLGVTQGTAAHLTCKTPLGEVSNELEETGSTPDADRYVYIEAKSGMGNVSIVRS